jgi:hypothetical protein
MLYGWILRAELQKLLPSFLERGGDPYPWAYCAATTLDAIAPGRNRVLFMPSGHAYRGKYFRTWAECTPQNILCEGKNRLALTLDEVPSAILRAAEAACKAAGKRRFHIFLKGSTIARMLGVTQAERERLGLRLIGAIDTGTQMDAAEKKRERDRRRDECKRREAGAKPRSETAAEQARQEGISPATLRKRKQRERERQAQHVTFSSPLNAGPNVTHSSPLHEAENTILNQVDKEREMKHVTLSSPHKYYEVISSVAHDLPSDEPQPAGEADSNPAAAALEGAASEPTAAEPATTQPETIATVTSPGSRRYTLQPKPLVLIDGFPVQIFHWIGCGAHSAAAQMQRLAESGARGAFVLSEMERILFGEHDLLAKRMTGLGADEDEIWRAIVAMDDKTGDLNAEAREMGVPLADMWLPDNSPAPIPPSPDGRAWRAAA